MPETTYTIQLPYGLRMYLRIRDEGIVEALEALTADLQDLRPVWRKVANVMRHSFAENFRAGGRPDKWAPLKPGTVFGKSMSALEGKFPYATMRGRRRVRRLAQLRGDKVERSLANILIARGDYRDSWVQKSGDHVERISKEGLEVGSKHWLVDIHENGTGTYAGGSAYPIRPRRARSLRFFGGGGEPVFRMLVMHPGVPARPVGIIQDEDLEAVANLIEGHLEGRSTGAV